MEPQIKSLKCPGIRSMIIPKEHKEDTMQLGSQNKVYRIT